MSFVFFFGGCLSCFVDVEVLFFSLRLGVDSFFFVMLFIKVIIFFIEDKFMLYEVVDGKVFVFTLEDWFLFNKFIMEISFFDLFLNIVLIV